MTLLEATTTLLDAVKTYAPEDDRVIIRATKRMEKRLLVLQVRHAKARKRNRTKAFWCAMQMFGGGACTVKHTACFPCPACKQKLYFGDFIRNAGISDSGRFLTMSCPRCSCLIERPSEPKP